MARDWPHLPRYQSQVDADAETPDGWTCRQIEDLFEKLAIGKRHEQKTALPFGKTPIIDQSADGVLGFHNHEPGIHAAKDSPVITFANHTCEMRVMRRPFSVIQNVFPMAGKRGLCDTLFFY
jgi:type I restriction enzyme S subunit